MRYFIFSALFLIANSSFTQKVLYTDVTVHVGNGTVIENAITNHIDAVSAFSLLTCFTGSNGSKPRLAPLLLTFLSSLAAPERCLRSAEAAAIAVWRSTMVTAKA